MAKLLLVETEGPPSAVGAALADAGHDVATAPSGSFALTMLEWNRPDAIISRVRLGDMQGDELCVIVRSDPATKEIPFVLLGEPGVVVAGAASAGVDLVVPGDVPLPAVVLRIRKLLRRARLGPVAGLTGALDVGAGAARARSTDAVPPLNFQGSLSVMELTDVLQALARAHKTGRLAVSLTGGEGIFVFDAGRVVHAEYAGHPGERAVAEMIVQAEEGGTFAFFPLARYEVRERPRTIDATVERLLLEVAAQIDESRAATDHPGAILPTSVEKG